MAKNINETLTGQQVFQTRLVRTEGNYWNCGSGETSTNTNLNVSQDHIRCVSYDSPRNSAGRLRLKANPYTLRKWRFRVYPGTKHFHDYRPVFSVYYCIQDTYGWHGDLAGVTNLGDLSFGAHPDYEVRATSRFYSSISQKRTDLLVAFRERKQTYDLITSTANRFSRVILSLKSGNVREAFRQLGLNKTRHGRLRSRSWQDTWLEMQYGWKPLLSDIHGVLEATVDKPILIPLKVTEKWSDKKLYTKYPGYISDWDNQYTLTLKGQVLFDNTIIFTELGLDNPLLTVWDSLPYSFVVDWFLPVGLWLEHENALRNGSLLDFSRTITRKSTGSYYGRPPNRGKITAHKSDWTEYGSTYGTLERTDKVRDLIIPEIPPIKLRNPFSPYHSISSLALLKQRFGR